MRFWPSPQQKNTEPWARTHTTIPPRYHAQNILDYPMLRSMQYGILCNDVNLGKWCTENARSLSDSGSQPIQEPVWKIHGFCIDLEAAFDLIDPEVLRAYLSLRNVPGIFLSFPASMGTPETKFMLAVISRPRSPRRHGHSLFSFIVNSMAKMII